MKTQILFATAALMATSLIAATPKDEVKDAAKKLGDAANYSWRSTVEMGGGGGGGGRFRPGPTDGKAAKDGTVHLTMTRGENTVEAVLKGDKGAIKTDEGWQSLAEASEGDPGQPNRGRFMARMLRTFKAPAAQIDDLLAKVKDLAKADDACTGDLTEAGVKELLSFGPRRDGSEGPEVSGAKGTVKFWIKDGLISKYEFHVQGTMRIGDNDRELDRTTTVEIKDVGKTQLVVPDEAKKKLS